mgnify:CR=1 FL=1
MSELPPEPSPYVDDDDDGSESWNTPGLGFPAANGPAYGYGGPQAAFATGKLPPVVAAKPGGAVQFSAKYNNNGRWEELGAIDVNCTHDDIIERWYEVLNGGGRVLLFPLDNLGRVISGYDDEPFTVDFSPSHDAITRAKLRRSPGGANMGMGMGMGMGQSNGGGNGVNLDELLRRQDERHQQQLGEIRAELRSERERIDHAKRELADDRKVVDEQRVALAVTSNQQTAEQFQRVQETVQQQNASTMEMIIGLFTAQTQASDQRHQQQVERMREEARLDRERAGRDREDYDRRETSRKDEERRHQESQTKREREDRMSREQWVSQAHERDLTSQREHAATTLALIERKAEQQDMGAQFQKMAAYAIGIAGSLGIDIKDGGLQKLVQTLSGGGGGGILETVGDVAKTFASAAIEMKKLETDGGGDGDEMVIVQTPQGPVQMSQSQLMQFQQQMIAMQDQPPQEAAAMLPYQGAGVEVPGNPMQQGGAEPIPGLPPWPGHAAQQQQQQQQPMQQAPPLQLQSNPAGQLPPQVQKAGRKAVRVVVQAVAQTPGPGRGDVLMQGIMQHLADLGPYLEAVGVGYAVREAGADDALTGEIIALVQQSGMLPQQIPM